MIFELLVEIPKLSVDADLQYAEGRGPFVISWDKHIALQTPHLHASLPSTQIIRPPDTILPSQEEGLQNSKPVIQDPDLPKPHHPRRHAARRTVGIHVFPWGK